MFRLFFMRAVPVLGLVAGLVSCAASPPPAPAFVVEVAEALALSPRQVVERAADAEGRAIWVGVQFVVAATGEDAGILYLNAYEDYRDQRNVSIVVPPEAQAGLRERFGGPEQLVGRRIEVRGWARRQTIAFTDQSRPTGAYYFQTHLTVTDAGRIRIVDGS